jgi:hypothetical protein
MPRALNSLRVRNGILPKFTDADGVPIQEPVVDRAGPLRGPSTYPRTIAAAVSVRVIPPDR